MDMSSPARERARSRPRGARGGTRGPVSDSRQLRRRGDASRRRRRSGRAHPAVAALQCASAFGAARTDAARRQTDPGPVRGTRGRFPGLIASTKQDGPENRPSRAGATQSPEPVPDGLIPDPRSNAGIQSPREWVGSPDTHRAVHSIRRFSPMNRCSRVFLAAVCCLASPSAPPSRPPCPVSSPVHVFGGPLARGLFVAVVDRARERRGPRRRLQRAVVERLVARHAMGHLVRHAERAATRAGQPCSGHGHGRVHELVPRRHVLLQQRPVVLERELHRHDQPDDREA